MKSIDLHSRLVAAVSAAAFGVFAAALGAWVVPSPGSRDPALGEEAVPSRWVDPRPASCIVEPTSARIAWEGENRAASLRPGAVSLPQCIEADEPSAS